MGDMSGVIIAKSDQVNADDLVNTPMTITIQSVVIKSGTEQPVAINYGDPKKVYRPCKTMCKLIVAAWGAESAQYVGRSLTLYRDPKVKWGGLDVGGIRISHMSHLETTLTVALNETSKNKRPFTVKPLKTVDPHPKTERADAIDVKPEDVHSFGPEDLGAWADNFEFEIDGAEGPYMTAKETFAARKAEPEWAALKSWDVGRAKSLHDKSEAAWKKLRDDSKVNA